MTETKSAKRLPPWMSVKGAPERPNFDKFHQEKNALIAQRKAFIEEIKSLQAKMKEDKENDGIEKLRQQYKEQLDEIEKLMAVEKENKSKVTETIADVRQERQDLDKKARQYQKQVGCFSTVEEVDACITYLMEKMETSGKSATQMQKETDSKVKELRHVRHILSQNHSDDEQMQQIKMREDHLRGQLFEIQERIKKLAADRDYLLKERQEKTGVSKEKAKARSDMFQSITQLREKVNEVNTQLDKVFEEHKARVANLGCVVCGGKGKV
ncbi:hypothetical protein AGDE_10632 [Angomonas deanei]|nr:hypothetical protein AGDE_10632 [Angomonas deanei]|eukprot:EPY27706.1 hypothetical protein AGDE_10632 [Angomonas deanei]